MNYIVILNWNSAKETIACINSILELKNFNNTRIIICDNNSKVESYQKILSYLSSHQSINYIALSEKESETYKVNHQFYLIKNKKNYGYAGGNNRGIQFALNQDDMKYVWILNNDTEVQPNSLEELLIKSQSNNYGVCGSRLVELDNKEKVQGIGGIINPWFCTAKEVGSNFYIDDLIDEIMWESKIDYVIGASLLFTRKCLEEVGLLCEDYFLYYEEIDYCIRAKSKGFMIGIASKSIVFHQQGASTGKSKSDIADYCSVRNRGIIAKKYYSIFSVVSVRLSFFLVFLNRLFRFQFKRAFKYLTFIYKM